MKNLKGDDYMIIFLSVLRKFTSLVISSVYKNRKIAPEKNCALSIDHRNNF